MKTTILRRLEALEKEHRSYDQTERASLRRARMYIWIIVLAYYLGDLKPEDDDPFSAYHRALKFPSDDDVPYVISQEMALDYHNRRYDAYCRFFAARGLDLHRAPQSACFKAFVTSVDELPDQWLSWLRSNLKQYCSNVMIAPGSNLPRRISSDDFLH